MRLILQKSVLSTMRGLETPVSGCPPYLSPGLELSNSVNLRGDTWHPSPGPSSSHNSGKVSTNFLKNIHCFGKKKYVVF